MENNEVLKQIISSRRSIFPKEYSGAVISESVIAEVLASAEFAPNHKKTKPWRFRVFRGEDKKLLAETLAELYLQNTPPQLFMAKKYEDIKSKISKSDAIVTISVNFSGLVPEWEEIAATAMAVQNMYLTCTANQIGCYWSSPKFAESLNNFLGLDENQRCIGLLYMGSVSH